MALSTYDELKTSIADHLDRDDLTNQIDDFIDLAEARHKREIRIRQMISRSQVTLTASTPSVATDRFLALPADFLQMQVFRLLSDAAGTELKDNILNEVNLWESTRLRLDETDRPRFFNIHEEIEFDVRPDQAYTAEMIYYAELAPLSMGNPVNALLTLAPDAYLYGALVASAPFLMHDERIPIWGDLYAVTRDGLKTNDLAARHGGPLVARVAGITP